MLISELIKGLERAKLDVGDVEVLVEWSIGSRKCWPVLHVVHGELEGVPFCEMTIGLTDAVGEGDADISRMADEFLAAGTQLKKETR